MRPSLLALALTLAIAAPLAPAQESRLPDIGSSAGELLTPARQAEYGGMMLRELRNYGYLLEDPLLDEWLQRMGGRLGADSDQPRQPYNFFLLKDRQINAFATLGGYIGTNAGLILTAREEDEVAAVLSHEIAHVTQQHVLRGVERAQRDQIPILLGMLGAIVLAQAASENSSDDASQAAMVGAMGLMQQRQIDYTRSNESEADRVGIRTLARAGYEPEAMAGFFERMSQAMRGNRGGGRERTPDRGEHFEVADHRRRGATRSDEPWHAGAIGRHEDACAARQHGTRAGDDGQRGRVERIGGEPDRKRSRPGLGRRARGIHCPTLTGRAPNGEGRQPRQPRLSACGA